MTASIPICPPPTRLCLYAASIDAAVQQLRAGMPADMPCTWILPQAPNTTVAATDELLLVPATTGLCTLLRDLANRYPSEPLLWLDSREALPEDWLPRFWAAAAGAGPRVLSPLCSDNPLLDVRPLGLSRSTAEWDRLLWASAEHRLLPTDTWSSQLCLWPAGAAATLERVGQLPVGGSACVFPGLLIGSDTPPIERELAPALAAVRDQLRGYTRVPPLLGGSGRPLLLHVLHGWGGGAERFVRDYISADRRFDHLVLRADNDPKRAQPGRSLALYHDLDQPALRRWPLNQPILGTALEHDEYRQILASIRADFPLASVLVSSLIGHSLDALRTGLPTAIVCHDYYPLWPVLHADFGDASADFSPPAMAAAVQLAGERFSFSERRPAYWQRLRQQWLAAVHSADITLITPSACVQENYCRIEPTLGANRWQRIPHGLAAWPQPLPKWRPRGDRLRLLVPGRINGGKGEDLLAQLIPRLPDQVELVLLGAGRSGMGFFSARNLHVQLDYRREDLPSLLAEIRPNAALLLSTVAETFSYTLSEMQSLGVPVIATRRGSFIERLDGTAAGLLVEADVDSILATIDTLQRSPLPMPAPYVAVSLEAMAEAYAAVLTQATPAPAAVQLALPLQTQRDAARLLASAQSVELQRLQQQLRHDRAEIDRRSEWAREQTGLAEQRLRWARALEGERDQALQVWRAAEQQRCDAVAAQERLHALSERQRGEIEQLARQYAEQQQQIAELQRWVQAVSQQRDEFERERNDVLNSSSWRLTRPLRFARRKLAGSTARLRFRIDRLLSLQVRGLRSLRTRGVGATLRRIGQEFRPPQPEVPLHIPAPRADFDISGIGFPEHPAPRVSVIIPAYNHLDHTLTCLRSLTEHPSRCTAEIIVIDDCGQDNTADLLPGIAGLRFLRNPRNLGFIGACNAGAAMARGEFLVFLNNDTAVQPGWLDALVDTFASHDGVGLVGAKLVYPDGRLQEAGGIVFSDGSGWNYGRFDDPADPRYNYVRDVDYCSGAAIVLRRSLFESFGGFDPLYAPAYYEDTDLAMKVRASGLRVLYQPAAVVVHFEGISSGTDTGSGTKRYQVINQVKFMDRWRDALALHAPPGRDIAIAREHRRRRRVLVIDATTPQPDQDSGSVRLVNLLRLLLDDGNAVTFFADNRAWVERYTGDLQQLGVEVLWHPFLSDPIGWLQANGGRFDCVIVSRHYILSSYIESLRRYAPQARLVFDTVDLHYLREQRAAELADRDDLRRSAADTRERELDLILRSDVTLVVSPVEQELLAREAPGARVDVLSNVHEVFGCRRAFGQRSDLMFIGGFQHPPNIDAVQWFVHEVFPRVRAGLPEVRFHIIGSKANDELRALGNQPGVVFHGFVEDIEPFLDGCRIALAPLRYGAGVKGKVNMSMSYGQPVVATPVAVEGMYLRADEDVLVGTDAAAFAAAVQRLYCDEALWNRLSANGLANVEQHFSFAAARRAVRALLDD